MGYQGQYPGYDIMLWFCKMLSLGENGQSIQRISLYYFLKLQVNPQLSEKKSVKKGLTKINKGIIETKKDVCRTEITMGVSNNKLAALRHQNSEVIKV